MQPGIWRNTLSAIVLLSSITALAACSSMAPARDQPETKSAFVIGMSQANNAEPWRAAMNAQIAAAAEQYPQLEVIFADAAQDNARQVADIEKFIAQGIDLLIVSPNEATPLTNVVSRAYNEGIPVIVLDRKINGESYSMWIGADNKLIGKKAGEYVARWCREQQRTPCNVIELRGLEGSTPARERGDGFREGIAGNPEVKIVASQNADWLYDRAIPLTRAMLEVNAVVDVVYAHNDPMGEAAFVASQELKREPGRMLFVGIDALPTPDGGIQSVLEGRLSVTYVYPTGGAEAISWAIKLLTSEATPPKTLVLDTEEVTTTNAAELLKKYGGS